MSKNHLCHQLCLQQKIFDPCSPPPPQGRRIQLMTDGVSGVLRSQRFRCFSPELFGKNIKKEEQQQNLSITETSADTHTHILTYIGCVMNNASVNGCLPLCVGPGIDWRPVQGVLRLSPNDSRDQAVKMMNEWKTKYIDH